MNAQSSLLIGVLFAAVMPGPRDAEAPQQPARAGVMQRVEREQARYRRWDTNGDRVLTLREWRGGAAAFRQLDTDRDGRLTGIEVWIPMPSDPTSASEEDQRREDLLTAFYRADRNNDTRLTRAEWWNDRAAFARIDVNRDSVLTPGEFLATDEPIDLPEGTAGQGATETRAYQAGYQRGLSDGRQAGKEDKTIRNQWDLEGQGELGAADAGYTSAVGRLDHYQAGYRAGFRLGYKQGFGRR